MFIYASNPMPPMKTRRVVSLTVLLSFAVLALSGVLLFLSPQGRVAYWSRWTMLGLTKDQLSAVHTTFMVLFVVVSVWHIVLNWKPILGYLRNRSRNISLATPEMGVALSLTVFFSVGTLLGFFPFQQFLGMGEDVKAYWEASSGSPPWGHAEENTLDRFCRGMEDFERLESQRLVAIDCAAALTALRAEGLAVEGLNQRLVDIAEANRTTPKALAAIVVSVARPLTPEEAVARMQPASESTQPFTKPYSGLGRMTLASYAQEYGYALAEVQALLTAAGLSVDPEVSLRDEATRLGMDPEGLIEALNRQATGPEA